MISSATSHRALYVGATRGRAANHLAVTTDELDLGAARDILEYVLTNDPADIPAIAVRRDLEALGRQIQPEPVDPLTAAHQAVRDAMDAAQPYEDAIDAATKEVIDARSTLAGLERQHDNAGPLGRRRLREPISEARQSLYRAQDRLDLAVEQAEPCRDALDTATADRAALAAARRLEELRQSSAGRAQSRPGHELGLGL